MGAIYWQMNDDWPVASWSSIDYYGRWKALHYKARRFYAPVLLSLHENENEKIVNISNETLKTFTGNVCVAVKNNRMETLASRQISVCVEELSSFDIVLPRELSDLLDGAPAERFLEYALE